MVPKWKYDEAMDLGRTNAEAEALNDCGHCEKINDLEEKLDQAEKNEFYPYSMEIRVNGQKYKVV